MQIHLAELRHREREAREVRDRQAEAISHLEKMVARLEERVGFLTRFSWLLLSTTVTGFGAMLLALFKRGAP